jgi:hypothetical protein
MEFNIQELETLITLYGGASKEVCRARSTTLEGAGLIVRDGDKWRITELGIKVCKVLVRSTGRVLDRIANYKKPASTDDYARKMISQLFADVDRGYGYKPSSKARENFSTHWNQMLDGPLPSYSQYSRMDSLLKRLVTCNIVRHMRARVGRECYMDHGIRPGRIAETECSDLGTEFPLHLGSPPGDQMIVETMKNRGTIRSAGHRHTANFTAPTISWGPS